MQLHESSKAVSKYFLKQTVQQLLIYKHRYKSRKVLLKLDERMLEDIGISKNQAQQEAQKPFWKGDSFVFDINEYTKFEKQVYEGKMQKAL